LTQKHATCASAFLRNFFTIRVHEGGAVPETEDAANRLAPKAAQERIFAGNRLLLAGDVDINREILITLLEDTGVLIDSAENCREACDMFSAGPERYDMIFMDIHMPEMDGHEATRLEVFMSKTYPLIYTLKNRKADRSRKTHKLCRT
jgi:PleD family two-component response regulator